MIKKEFMLIYKNDINLASSELSILNEYQDLQVYFFP